MSTLRVPARSFFLDAPFGRRFALYHAPAAQSECRGVIVYAPPFGDEMNMSRRMAAKQARAFSDRGFAVLQIDLFGCGDSSGDVCDATWDIWRQDLVNAMNWARAHVSSHVILWGLRLGATLAIDIARSSTVPIDSCIAWHPVTSGRQYTSQLLRMRLAEDMIGRDTPQDKTTAPALREMLKNGKAVEVGGYELAPALLAEIDQIDLGALDVLPCPVHWFEMVRDENSPIPLARMSVIQAWMNRGIEVHLQAIPGPNFWGTREISECQALISSSVQLLEEVIA